MVVTVVVDTCGVELFVWTKIGPGMASAITFDHTLNDPDAEYA